MRFIKFCLFISLIIVTVSNSYLFASIPNSIDISHIPKELIQSVPYFYKSLIIDNGEETIETVIPFLNSSYLDELEKQYACSLNKINYTAIMQQSQDDKNYYQIPFPLEIIKTEENLLFNPYRKKAFTDLEKLHKICLNGASEKFNHQYEKAAYLVYGTMLKNYNLYPDICLASRLYMMETIMARYSKSFFSGSVIYNEYKQIKENYIHKPNISLRSYSMKDRYDYGKSIETKFDIIETNLKTLSKLIDVRFKMIHENDNIIFEKLNKLTSENEIIYKRIITLSDEICNGNNSSLKHNEYYEKFKKLFLNNIKIYEMYMEIGCYEKAHEIFDITLENKSIKFNGIFNITGQKILKYKNTSGMKERLIPIYNEILLTMVAFYRLCESNHPNRNEKLGGGKELKNKIKACCKFIADFDTSEASIGKIGDNSNQNIKIILDTAFGYPISGYERYFVGTQSIKQVFFTLDELYNSDESMISDPYDVLTMRCLIEHQKPFAPYFSLENSIESSSSERKKDILLHFEYFNGSYYSKFCANESRENDPKSNVIDASEGQRKPQPLPENMQKEDDFGIAENDSKQIELERQAPELPLFLVNNNYEVLATSKNDDYLISTINDNAKNESPLKTVDYAVEIIARQPDSLETAYAIDFIGKTFYHNAPRLLYKKLFREHYSTLKDYKTGILGKILLSYFMAAGVSAVKLDSMESKYLTKIGIKTLNEISDKHVISKYSSLALLCLADVSYNEGSIEYYEKFAKKYPLHSAIPFVKLKILKRKLKDIDKEKYNNFISEINLLSKKHENVIVPFNKFTMKFEFDYLKAKLLINYNKIDKAIKIVKKLKQVAPNYDDFQELFEEFEYKLYDEK